MNNERFPSAPNTDGEQQASSEDQAILLAAILQLLRNIPDYSAQVGSDSKTIVYAHSFNLRLSGGYLRLRAYVN